MKFVVLEDNRFQADAVADAIIHEFGVCQADIDVIRTEHEFRSRIDQIIADKPTVFILDMLVRWTDPAPEMPDRPQEVKEEGFYLAGLRCAKLLREKSSDTPVILHTVIERAELSLVMGAEAPAHIVQKDPTLRPLLDTLQTIVFGGCAGR